MKCWQCDNDARAICIFCGRTVCKTHVQEKNHFAGFGRKERDAILQDRSKTAYDVVNAVWCGQCTVEYNVTPTIERDTVQR